MRAITAFPLGLLLLVAPFLALGRDLSHERKLAEQCPDYFAALEHNRKAKAQAIADNVVLPSDKIQKILNSYPRTPEGERQQITDLIDLRLELERRGKFTDPQLEEKYKALEWKNLALGLIPDDIHGRKFLEEINKFGKYGKAEKLLLIEKYSASRHPGFESRWQGLLPAFQDRAADPEVELLLREVAAGRRMAEPYQTNPYLQSQVIASVKNTKDPRGWIPGELALLPEDKLRTLLVDADPEVRRRAAFGLNGRPKAVLHRILTNYPDDETRAIALHLLPLSLDDQYFHFLNHALIQDTGHAVKLEALNRAGILQDPRTLPAIREAAKSSDETIASTAQKALAKFDPEFKAQSRAPTNAALAGESLSDEALVAALGNQSGAETVKLVDLIKTRPLKVRLEALKSPNAKVRLAVARQLSADAALSPDLIYRLMTDPILEVRLHAIYRAGQKAQDPQLFEALMYTARNDEFPAARSAARSQLDSMNSGRNQLAIYKSDEALYDHYRAMIARQFGAPGARSRDLNALAVAQHVYLIPEADTADTALELVVRHRKFRESVPLGYRPGSIVGDPKTGFKGAIYVSADTNPRPLMVGMAGTETPSDVLADLNFGTLQMRSRNFRGVIDKTVAHLNQARKIGRPIPEVEISGHSLGGALSHVFVSDLKEAMIAAGIPEGETHLRVLTWNGLGGVKPLERLGKYNAEATKKVDATNYYVPHDWVSLISEQIGEKVPLPGLNIKSPLKVHGIASVKTAFEKLGVNGDLNDTSRVYTLKLLPWLTKFTGPLTDAIQVARYHSKEKQTFLKIAKARLLWAKQEDYKSLTHSYDWLKEELDTAAMRMVGKDGRKKALEYIERVEKMRNTIIEEKQREAYLAAFN